MSKQAVSVTLSPENVSWLKGLAKAKHLRSMSEALDNLLSEARNGLSGPARSVVGTVSIDPIDPDLTTADVAVRAIFALSQSTRGRARRKKRVRLGRHDA